VSDKTDKKLVEVRAAEFRYRHEAEFAAGFLDDAGIPYRLQVDDPAMGLTIASPAVLWVRALDLEEVREVLHMEDDDEVAGLPATTARARPPVARTPGPSRLPHRLGSRERLLLVTAAGLIGWGVWASEMEGATLRIGLALAGGMFVLAVLGRAPAVIAEWVRVLTGGEPT
jgi:hypothetical protein